MTNYVSKSRRDQVMKYIDDAWFAHRFEYIKNQISVISGDEDVFDLLKDVFRQAPTCYKHMNHSVMIKHFQMFFRVVHVLTYCCNIDPKMYRWILDKAKNTREFINEPNKLDISIIAFMAVNGRKITSELLDEFNILETLTAHKFEYNRRPMHRNILLFLRCLKFDSFDKAVPYIHKIVKIVDGLFKVDIAFDDQMGYVSGNLEKLLCVYYELIGVINSCFNKQSPMSQENCKKVSDVLDTFIGPEHITRLINKHRPFHVIDAYSRILLKTKTPLTLDLCLKIRAAITDPVVWKALEVLQATTDGFYEDEDERYCYQYFQHYKSLFLGCDTAFLRLVSNPTVETIETLRRNGVAIGRHLFMNKYLSCDTFEKYYDSHALVDEIKNLIEQSNETYGEGADSITILNSVSEFQPRFVRNILLDDAKLNVILDYVKTENHLSEFDMVIEGVDKMTIPVTNNFVSPEAGPVAKKIKPQYLYNGQMFIIREFQELITNNVEHFIDDREYQLELVRRFPFHALPNAIYKTRSNYETFDTEFRVPISGFLCSSRLLNGADVAEVNDIINDVFYTVDAEENCNLSIKIDPFYLNTPNINAVKDTVYTTVLYNGFKYLNLDEIFSNDGYSDFIKFMCSSSVYPRLFTHGQIHKYMDNIHNVIAEKVEQCDYMKKRYAEMLLSSDLPAIREDFYVKMYRKHLLVFKCQNIFVKDIYYNPRHPCGKRRAENDYKKLTEEFKDTPFVGMLGTVVF